MLKGRGGRFDGFIRKLDACLVDEADYFFRR